MGDFNVDINKNDNDSQTLLNNFLELGYYRPYFNGCTRISDSNNENSCIDNTCIC